MMKTARFHFPRSLLLAALFAASSLLQAHAAAPEFGEAFGLRLGMTKAEVQRLGVNIEKSGVSDTWGQRYRALRLPKEFGGERWIWLYFGTNDKLFRIQTELADRGIAFDSESAIHRYRELKGSLSSKYSLVSAREPTRPNGKPCLNPNGALSRESRVFNAAAKKFYENALKAEGPHKLVSMMHFCTIQKWSTTYSGSDTLVTLTLLPQDVHQKTSYAFIRVDVESKSLKEKYLRVRSPL